MGKRSRTKRQQPTLSEKLEIIFTTASASPTAKLIISSMLWDDVPGMPDYFESVKSFVGGLDNNSPEGEDELVALYQEYAAKNDVELVAEVKELKKYGLITKKQVKLLSKTCEGERRRQLFVRILIIADECGEEEEDEEEAAAGAAEESGALDEGALQHLLPGDGPACAGNFPGWLTTLLLLSWQALTLMRRTLQR